MVLSAFNGSCQKEGNQHGWAAMELLGLVNVSQVPAMSWILSQGQLMCHLPYKELRAQ